MANRKNSELLAETSDIARAHVLAKGLAARAWNERFKIWSHQLGASHGRNGQQKHGQLHLGKRTCLRVNLFQKVLSPLANPPCFQQDKLKVLSTGSCPIQTHRDDQFTFQTFQVIYQPRWNIDLNLACLCINEVFQVMKRMKAVGSRPSTAWHCEGGGKRCELYDHYDLMGGWVWVVVQAVWRKNETRMKHQWKWCKQASSATNQTRVHSWSWRSSHLSCTLQ